MPWVIQENVTYSTLFGVLRLPWYVSLFIVGLTVGLKPDKLGKIFYWVFLRVDVKCLSFFFGTGRQECFTTKLNPQSFFFFFLNQGLDNFWGSHQVSEACLLLELQACVVMPRALFKYNRYLSWYLSDSPVALYPPWPCLCIIINDFCLVYFNGRQIITNKYTTRIISATKKNNKEG